MIESSSTYLIWTDKNWDIKTKAMLTSPLYSVISILGIVLCLTAPGIPMLFQGQEFLEDEYFKDTEGLDWQKYERLKGIERMVTDLINFRKGAVPGLEALSGQHVEILHTDHENKVFKNSTFGGVLSYVAQISKRDYINFAVQPIYYTKRLSWDELVF